MRSELLSMEMFRPWIGSWNGSKRSQLPAIVNGNTCQ